VPFRVHDRIRPAPRHGIDPSSSLFKEWFLMKKMKFEDPDFPNSIVTTFRLPPVNLDVGDPIQLMQQDGTPWDGYPHYRVTGVETRPWNQMPRSLFRKHHSCGREQNPRQAIEHLMRRYYGFDFWVGAEVTCIWLKKIEPKPAFTYQQRGARA